MPDAATASSAALRTYAREPGRSVLLRVRTATREWTGGVAEDVPRPAASLLKLPLAVAAEDAIEAGRLDPAAEHRAGDLLRAGDRGTILAVLDPARRLSTAELLGIMLSASDTPCARWLAEQVGHESVVRVLAQAGCDATSVTVDLDHPSGPLLGRTTARDALRLLDQVLLPGRAPMSAAALGRSIRNSRIPLGANEMDVRIAHKTGTLPGVAHDVALIESVGGSVAAAFLTDHQHDTLVSGYEMGACTRAVLEAWDLAVTRTTGVLGV